MVNYRGKKKKATRPQPQPDKYQDDRYLQARLELVDALAERERLERELEEERARPRLGCKRCNFTGLNDWINPQTGEVTVGICPECAPLIDQFIERYTGWNQDG